MSGPGEAEGPMTVAALRAAFDDGFAAPVETARGEVVRLLLVRVADEPCALRVSELRAVARDRKVVPLPGGPPDLVGLAGVRGELLPVHCLACLLGHPPRRGGQPRWLLVAAGEPPAALAVDAVEGYREVPAGHLAAVADSQADVPGLLREAVVLDGVARRVVSIAGVVAGRSSAAGLR